MNFNKLASILALCSINILINLALALLFVMNSSSQVSLVLAAKEAAKPAYVQAAAAAEFEITAIDSVAVRQ